MMPVIRREMDRCEQFARVRGLIVEVLITMSVEPVIVHLGANLIGVTQGHVTYEMEITERGAPPGFVFPRELSFAVTEDDVLVMLQRLADAYEFGQGLVDFRPPRRRPVHCLLVQFELIDKPWKGYVRWR
ncbi:MAG: hypothetical protein ABW167_07750 [Baekduia sp.]